ncbi:FHA domain-containing protein [Gemmata algarum]|nr:FHA domain-containing protein [Gemmata algarum]
MSDPRLQSMHLEGQLRRDTFRSARERLQAACGSHTLAGERNLPAPGPVATEGALPSPVILGRFTFFLKDESNVYPLRLGMNSIGRLPDNDIVLNDECVSRRHCAIVVHSDLRCELHDVASKNGTVLNGRHIPQPAKLQSGDQITLCNRRLTFHVTEAAGDVG